MMQPTPGVGVVPPPPPPQMAHQYQYQQQPPQQPPQQAHPSYMMMMPPQPQPQPPPMWAPTPQAAPQQGQQQPGQPGEIRTLWIGDLQYWMDENYISSCFAPTGEVVSVKVIRNKQTGQVEGYGFIEFITRAGAERVLQTYNGTLNL